MVGSRNRKKLGGKNQEGGPRGFQIRRDYEQYELSGNSSWANECLMGRRRGK